MRLARLLSRLEAGIAVTVMLFVPPLLVDRRGLLVAVRVTFPTLRGLYFLLRNDRRQTVSRALRRLRAGWATDVDRVAGGKCLLHGLVKLF
jgi:hypothetical protein